MARKRHRRSRRVSLFSRLGRRHRRRNPGRRARRMHRRHRRRGRNPGIGGMMSIRSLTAGFNMGALKEAGLIVLGSVANGMASKMLIDRLPGTLGTAPISYLPALATAGLLSGLARMAGPQYSAPILTGGIVQVALKAMSDYFPSVPRPGTSDYLTAMQVARAVPLNGLGDYLTIPQAASARQMMSGYGDDLMQAAADSFETGVL
jgi:hypothetical protein